MVQYDATQIDALKENFTRAINIARERGAFETFSAKVNLGKVGLCENMFDDYKGDGVCEGWMWKTGGDVMQGYWQELHETPHSCQWSNTVGQAAASQWLHLPQLVHGKALGDYVASWNDHSLADHDEAVKVLLPPKLLHVFCWLHALCYHQNNAYLNTVLCSHRTATGELCPKKARHDNLCWKHRWLPPPTIPHAVLLGEHWREADSDPDKLTIMKYMAWLVAKPREERRLWWKSYLLEHHPDHHPEYRAAGATETSLHETALCDYVKRARPWFLACAASSCSTGRPSHSINSYRT